MKSRGVVKIMGSTQSTNRAAKFSGSTNRERPRNASQTTPTMRRQLSRSNTNRNVKEFSKFWSGGGSFRPSNCSEHRRSQSVRRSNSVRRTRNQVTERSHQSLTSISPLPTSCVYSSSPRNQDVQQERPSRKMLRHDDYCNRVTYHSSYEDQISFDSNDIKLQESEQEHRQAIQFPLETAIYN